ncbi:MAG: NAD-dependent DNA ligase LigA [Oscillospiraceae bacterium]|jgi:DNA ligase (NAD+)|nr:NAD-dependent DNA ligase LigA [Oscillospiraceae bacterium]
MDIKKAILIAQNLRAKIEYHNRKYYEDNSPEIEDSEFDAIKRKLEEIENAFPQIALNNSPTQIIGGKASEMFSPVCHKIKMESLHDSFSYEEISAFLTRVKNSAGDASFTVEPKIDGISISVEYKNGILFRASTRGDGKTGEDITENSFEIRNLPKKIDTNLAYLEVRGECFMPKFVFKNLVRNQEIRGERPFKNPRNAAAGSIRLKIKKKEDISKITERGLEILFFNVQQIQGVNFLSHKESLNYIKNIGLPIIEYAFCKNESEVFKEIEKIDQKRHKFSFQSDGAVIKVDCLEKRKILGSTSNFPRWAEAYKYAPEEKSSKLLKIEIQVGRTGVLTPVGVFEPVELAGTLISRASLHNEDFIKEKNIKIGCKIFVRKAGDIIPEIIRTEHNDNEISFKMPKKCPSCGFNVIKKAEEVAIRCLNKNCPEKVRSQIIHFSSRDAMDIEELGENTVKTLQKDLKSIIDIYKINESVLKKYREFIKISGYQESFGSINANYLNKIGKNLLSSIEKSKTVTFSRLIYALGIPFVGQEASRILSLNFKNDKELTEASFEKIIKIDGLGPSTASAIIDFFSENKTIFSDLKKLGVIFNNELKKSFFGLTFALTGNLSSFTRSEAKEKIEELSGKISNTISPKVSFLICGKNPGRKLSEAKKIGLKILNENGFIEMIKYC